VRTASFGIDELLLQSVCAHFGVVGSREIERLEERQSLEYG
jgi:hypothetical protein